MRWLADECIHPDIVRELRAAGHDVVYALEVARRAPDDEHASRARAEHRIMLSEDKDLAEIAHRDPRAAPGTVLLRCSVPRRSATWPQLQRAIELYGDRLLVSLTVIDEARIRQQLLSDIIAKK